MKFDLLTLSQKMISVKMYHTWWRDVRNESSIDKKFHAFDGGKQRRLANKDIWIVALNLQLKEVAQNE